MQNLFLASVHLITDKEFHDGLCNNLLPVVFHGEFVTFLMISLVLVEALELSLFSMNMQAQTKALPM